MIRRAVPVWLLIALACAVAAAGSIAARAGTLSVSFSQVATGSVVNLTDQGAIDWVHWGLFTETSVDRKSGVTPRIGNFTALDNPTNGSVAIYQYSDNWNGYTWNDGTPHMVVSNTTTGVWAYDATPKGSGFRFSVPAKTTLQTLKVYVGAFNAKGKFVASLSDDSAPEYTSSGASVVDNTGNGPGGVYTISFAAGSAGQLLTIAYTLDSQNGSSAPNVTLQAAALTEPGANNPPYASLTSLADGASFTGPTNLTLTASANDADGSVVRVEFYSGTNLVGQSTNAPWTATWTNVIPGRYIVTARATDASGAAGVSPPVTVYVAGLGGSVAGSRSTAPTAIDMSAEGSSDWAHWGLQAANSFNHRTNGGNQVSTLKLLGTNVFQRLTNARTGFSWTNGTPVVSASAAHMGVYVTGLTNGFEIRAPAGTNARTLRIYAGLYGAQGNFEAYLTDFSAKAYVDTSLSNIFGNSWVIYTLNYTAATSGTKLVVRYTTQDLYDNEFGNINIEAATLQGPPPPASNSPPIVSITSPVNGTILIAPADVTIEATASDADGPVTQVAFFNGTNLLGVDTTAPYTMDITGLPVGVYRFAAVATDEPGAQSTNSVTITVTNLAPNNPPAVTITGPADGSTFAAPATFALFATASDSDGTVDQVEFFLGTEPLGIATTSPYSAQAIDIRAGVYAVSAVATDNAGGRATNTISIIVTNVPTAAVTLRGAVVASNAMEFQFDTQAGKTYSVEATTSLPATNWQALTNFTGEGRPALFREAITNRTRIYRVNASP